MTHDKDVGLRERIFEKITGMKAQPLIHTLRLCISLEHGLYDRQIHAASGEMFLQQRDLDRHTALRASDVHKGVVLLPGKFFGDGASGPYAEAGHGLQKSFEPLRVRVERAEEVFARLDLVLRLPGLQGFGQRTPE